MEPREFNWPASAIYSAGVSFLGPGYDWLALRMGIGDEIREVLDVGGGNGMLAISLTRIYPDLTRIVSSDIAPDIVKRAAKNVKRAWLDDRIECEVQDAHALGYPDGEFDCVVSTISMHHWLRPGEALREMDRVLRPGGSMIIIDGYGRPSIFAMWWGLQKLAYEYTMWALPGSLPFVPGSRPLLYFITMHIAPFYRHASKDVLLLSEIEEAVEESGLSYLSIETEYDLMAFVRGTKP